MTSRVLKQIANTARRLLSHLEVYNHRNASAPASMGNSRKRRFTPSRDKAVQVGCDDLHVGVRMRGKARVGGDLVVVPHSERAMAQALGVVIAGEGEVMLRLQPAMVSSRSWECPPFPQSGSKR
jgi:hypothetical protein